MKMKPRYYTRLQMHNGAYSDIDLMDGTLTEALQAFHEMCGYLKTNARLTAMLFDRVANCRINTAKLTAVPDYINDNQYLKEENL